MLPSPLASPYTITVVETTGSVVEAIVDVVVEVEFVVVVEVEHAVDIEAEVVVVVDDEDEVELVVVVETCSLLTVTCSIAAFFDFIILN